MSIQKIYAVFNISAMFRRGGNNKPNMFRVKRSIQKPIEPPPMSYEEYEDDEPAPPQIVRPKRVKNRLPGEKLLRQLHRGRQQSRISEKLAAMKI